MSALDATKVCTYKWLRWWFLCYVYFNMKIIFENGSKWVNGKTIAAVRERDQLRVGNVALLVG